MNLKRIAAWTGVCLLILALAGLLVVGWIGSEKAIHPAAATYPKSLADFPDLHPRDVGFDSRTHTTIAAEFFPGERHATIVLSHGYGDNQVQMLPYADFLHKHGFSILTYDMRNRGRSAGDAVTLGALEQLDLISAVDYLVTRTDVDRDRIGALGVSLGGSTTLLSSAADPRIKAVVDDSGFSDAPKVIESSFEHFIGLPPFPFVRESLELLQQNADAVVVSQTPTDALVREWREHSLESLVRLIAGQELGTKKQHLKLATEGRYAQDHVLMIGDAPGDYDAARANKALFFPVNPGHEEASWERFYKEGIHKFLNGEYAGKYEAGLIAEFEKLLPSTPPWQK